MRLAECTDGRVLMVEQRQEDLTQPVVELVVLSDMHAIEPVDRLELNRYEARDLVLMLQAALGEIDANG